MSKKYKVLKRFFDRSRKKVVEVGETFQPFTEAERDFYIRTGCIEPQTSKSQVKEKESE